MVADLVTILEKPDTYTKSDEEWLVDLAAYARLEAYYEYDEPDIKFHIDIDGSTATIRYYYVVNA